MKLIITDDDHDDFESDSRYLIFSTDEDIFIGGKLSINDVYDSLAALILKSYDVINRIIEMNKTDFDKIDFNFQRYMTELTDSVIYNLHSSDIIQIDKNELLKQAKQLNRKDLATDILDLINDKNFNLDDEDNDEDDI